MAASTKILSREQLAFLRDNFVVYDPESRECSQDFIGLENCQLILMGEIHSTDVLWKLQRQFFEIIIGNQPICMLAETLPPGVILTSEEMRQWRDYLPPMTEVRGADVREQGESAQFSGSAQFIEWENLNRRVNRWSIEEMKRESDEFLQLAGILNDHFTSGFSSGIDKDRQMFLLSDEVSQVVAKLVENMGRQKKLRYEECAEICLQKDQLRLSASTEDLAIVRSNLGLFQGIEKASKVSKAIAIWGSDHFTTDDDLIKALDRARISYVILLPNTQRNNEAMDEVKWREDENPKFELKVGKNTEPLVLEAPEIHRSYLHPDLQAICMKKTEEPIVLDFEVLKELFLKGNSLEFPPGKVVHFENIPLADFNKFKELFYEKTSRTMVQPRAKMWHLETILNNLLMVHGRSVSALRFIGELICSVMTSSENRLVLKLGSDKGWSLTATSNSRMGYVSYLFQEMKRLNKKEYSLGLGEELIFLDFPAEERARIIKNPNEIIRWMESKLPPRSQLKLEGDLSSSPTLIIPFEDHPGLPSVVLSTQTGFTITLS